jgi:hypothetical protein
MIDILSHKGNANQKDIEIPLIAPGVAMVKETTTAGENVGEMDSFHTVGGNGN